MENSAAPPAGKEAQDDAEVVDVAKKKKGEREEKKKEDEEEERDEKRRWEETPRSLKTMSPSEKVFCFLMLLLFVFLYFFLETNPIIVKVIFFINVQVNLWLPGEDLWDSEDGNLANLAMSPIIEVESRFKRQNVDGQIAH